MLCEPNHTSIANKGECNSLENDTIDLSSSADAAVPKAISRRHCSKGLF